MNIVKKVISYILGFVLMCLLICIIALNIASKTILKKQYMVSKIEANNYYVKLDENIKESFGEYIQQSGLDEEVLEGLYSEEDIKNDVGIIINNIYENKSDKIDTTKIRTNLKQNINVFLKTTRLTAEQSEAINEFVDRIAEKYESEITHTEYINEASKIITKVNKYINKAEKVLLVAIAVNIIIILLINIKTISIGFSSLFISVLATGIILIVPKIFINMFIDINNIMIIDQAFSNLVRSIVFDILGNITKYGITCLVSSVILILIVNIIKYQKEEG